MRPIGHKITCARRAAGRVNTQGSTSPAGHVTEREFSPNQAQWRRSPTLLKMPECRRVCPTTRAEKVMTKEELIAIRGEPEWRPCVGCQAPVFDARHERTKKLAPLLRPREGGSEPNIVAWQGVDGWQYRIVPRPSLDSENVSLPGSQPQPEFINHFADCPAARRFKK